MGLTIYEASRPGVFIVFKLLCRWKVNGRMAKLPDGPVIIVSNHLSWLDIPLLGLSFPKQIAFMGKEEYFHSRVHRVLLKLYGGFTVERGTVDRTALGTANAALKAGIPLGIFPEGTRSRGLQLQRGHLGAAYLAMQSNACIIPVGISGTEKIKDRYENKAKLFSRPNVLVNVGEPIRLPASESGKPDKRLMASSTDLIMRSIARLLPPAYRGVYSDVEAGITRGIEFK